MGLVLPGLLDFTCWAVAQNFASISAERGPVITLQQPFRHLSMTEVEHFRVSEANQRLSRFRRYHNAGGPVIGGIQVQPLTTRDAGERPDRNDEIGVLILLVDPFFDHSWDRLVEGRAYFITGNWSRREQRLGEHFHHPVLGTVAYHPSHLGDEHLQFTRSLELRFQSHNVSAGVDARGKGRGEQVIRDQNCKRDRRS